MKPIFPITGLKSLSQANQTECFQWDISTSKCVFFCLLFTSIFASITYNRLIRSIFWSVRFHYESILFVCFWYRHIIRNINLHGYLKRLAQVSNLKLPSAHILMQISKWYFGGIIKNHFGYFGTVKCLPWLSHQRSLESEHPFGDRFYRSRWWYRCWCGNAKIWQ